MHKLLLSAALVLGAPMLAEAKVKPPPPPPDPVSYSDCHVNIMDNVSGAYDCEISTADQDFLETTPMTVNADGGFFDINTWEFLDKEPAATGSGQTGTYNFIAEIANLNLGSLNLMIDKLMLVFKSGNGTTLVGYLVSTASGSWTSPFENPPFNVPNIKDVSHISAYYTTKPAAEVPLPAAGLLLVGALGGLGLAARRRRG